MAKMHTHRVLVPLLMALSATGCLRAREDHCVYTGGDFTEGMAPDSICVVLTSGAADPLVDRRGYYELPEGLSRATAAAPEGYLRVRYGVPQELGAEDSEARSTVFGVLFHALGGPVTTCESSTQGIEDIWGQAQESLQNFHSRLERGTLTRRARASFPRNAVTALSEELDAYVESCGGVVTDTGTGTTGPDPDTETGPPPMPTDSGSTSTGDVPCMMDAECPSSAPVCGDDGLCGTCDTAPKGAADEACEVADPTRPLCVDDECVECSAEDDSVCVNPTPTCGEANVCVACDAHEQCGDAACNFFTGECLPESAETVVRVGAGADFGNLTDALEAYPEGESGYTIRSVDTAMYNEALTVGSGWVVAFITEADVDPEWLDPQGMNAPQLTVEAGATALVHRLRIVNNNSDRGVVVRGKDSRLWVDRSAISRNDGGGILAEDGAELMVRNSFIGDFDTSANALTVDSSTATVLYSTLGAGLDFGGDAYAVSCTNPVDVTIRNSLLVSVDDAAEGEVSCVGAEITYNASETAIAGADETNVVLGEVQPDWFLNAGIGDFRLATPPPELATTALWEAGHPLVDIGGDPRPAGPDNADYAGADVP